MTNGNAQSKFFLPTELPVPAGTSPFRMKGSIYNYIVTHQVKRLGVGLDEVLKFVTDPKAREFLSQDFLTSGWYDYLPSLLFASAAVTVSGQPAEEYIRKEAAFQAETDLKGIYRVLLFFTSPETAMRRMPVVQQQYFKFGRAEVKIPEKGVAESTISGWPAIAAPFQQLHNSEYVHHILVLSGAKNPSGVWFEPEPDGKQDGIPTVCLHARTKWSR